MSTKWVKVLTAGIDDFWVDINGDGAECGPFGQDEAASDALMCSVGPKGGDGGVFLLSISDLEDAIRLAKENRGLQA